MELNFLKKIKTRIALSFSLLFLAVAIPAIIYAFSQVNLFFEGLYLQQMRVATLTARALFNQGAQNDFDKLVSDVSNITSSTVFLISPEGDLLARSYEDSRADTETVLSYPIPGADTMEQDVKHNLIRIGGRRFLQVQSELDGGYKLLQVKSFSRASMLMKRMREVIFWSSFLGLVALVAVAFWVSAKITRPLEELTIVAQQIRTGELPPKTNIRSPDEVGDLALALNEIIDSLSRSRERLGKLESIRSEFFANVKGRLELPLVQIQSALESYMASSRYKDSARDDRLENALSQARSLQRIIHTLIDISALEFGEANLRIEKVPIKRLLVDVTDEFVEPVTRRGLAFDLELAEGIENCDVLGDERLLRIVLESLLTNAADYTEKGSIRLACADEGGKISISVEDTGPGIPQDQLDRIFERLYKVDNDSQDEHFGLGLSIAKHIIKAHGQKLEAESRLGVGSKFSFQLDKDSFQ